MRNWYRALVSLALITLLGGTASAWPELKLYPDWPGSLVVINPYDTQVHKVVMKNIGDAELLVSQVIPVQLLPASPLWLTVSTTGPLYVAAGDSATVLVTVHSLGGVVNQQGTVVFWSDSRNQADSQSVNLQLMPPEPPDAFSDTLATSCTRLVVGSFGNIGSQGREKVNLDYFNFGDCDTVDSLLGNTKVYLYDGSPVILRHQLSPDSIFASWSIFNNGFSSPYEFKKVTDQSAPIFGHSNTITSSYQKVQSDELITPDSLLTVEKTWWAPRNSGDSCNFVIQQMRLFPYKGTAVSGLTIGEAIDWDIPSDTAALNTGGFDAGRNLVYQRGWDKPVDPTQCQPNSARFGGMAMLGYHTQALYHVDACANNTSMWGGYTAPNETYVYPTGGFVPRELWNNMQSPGFSAPSQVKDYHSVLTFTNNYTLPANETLTVYVALASVKNGTATDLRTAIDKAKRWARNHAIVGCPSCCTAPTTGDLNGDGTVDIQDISCLVDNLFIGLEPCWTCFAEADVDKSGSIDISDLQSLIDYLFNGIALPTCE
ncbi:MAG TPA: dockerin type I domain-containing protein [Candidatus Acidoferrum sp.]|nr:dockerin type I domain-containing protein [Candidatus Acidoferrum sp.]